MGMALAPEIAVLAAAVAAIFVHLFGKERGGRAAGAAALAGIAAAFLALLIAGKSNGRFFAGAFTLDGFAVFFKAVVLCGGLLAVAFSFRYFRHEGSEPGEAYYLILLAIVGMMFAVSATDLVTAYVAFETFAIPSYILTGFCRRDRRSPEAAVKYFFLGTLSSGIMLFGMALVFGLTGETNFDAIARLLGGAGEPLALTGMILFFAGLFFKAAFVPFHMWAPDVYEGAPVPIAVFLSTAPKAAVFALLIRVAAGLFGRFEAQWTGLFQVLALATMFWGNIAALLQMNIKRMMAYSSIAHAGYIAIGLAAWGGPGRTAVMFYLFVYAFMNAAAFGLVLLWTKGSGFGEEVSDLRGLARMSPLAAASLVLVLLSLTGIPPTAGFMGKYLLFQAAIGRKLYLLAAAGALNSAISLFYYFRIGRAMFMEDRPADSAEGRPSPSVTAV
ncbi:MAG: NADH-quinone oxidoreductase subunit N, partial [Candidatus Aminicenantes bacterium]|nr:NADH-quinone oxidoreductase subunit N [Candidatus Aminicenantes bacterium]